MNFLTILGLVAGIFTSASLLPQVIKIIKEKRVEDLSIGMFISLVIGVILWTIYGIMKKDLPIILTNSFSIILNCLVIGLRFKYKKNK